MITDLPLSELEHYRPAVAEQEDFDEFWGRQCGAARQHSPVLVAVDAVEVGITHADVFDVTFRGYGGDAVKGWLLLPHERAHDSKLVIEFVGYGGGRGTPLDWLTFSCAGHVHFVMDNRGQGGGWRGADTVDPHPTQPGSNGFLTQGVASAEGQYYVRLMVDAVRAVDAATSIPETAGLPVVATGGSQGGALSLVAASLAGTVDAVMPDVPFLADFARALRTSTTAPYMQVVEYCAVYPHQTELVFRNLSYIDVVNHAKRITVPGLFSVGLVDEVTPASTVYAAFNHFAGEKRMVVYPFNGHEGGRTLQLAEKLNFLSGELPTRRALR